MVGEVVVDLIEVADPVEGGVTAMRTMEGGMAMRTMGEGDTPLRTMVGGDMAMLQEAADMAHHRVVAPNQSSSGLFLFPALVIMLNLICAFRICPPDKRWYLLRV